MQSGLHSRGPGAAVLVSLSGVIRSINGIFGIRTFISIVAIGITGFVACEKVEVDETSTDDRNVMLLYSAGFNSLTSYLKSDIEELATGFIPGPRNGDNVLLVFSKLSSGTSYSKKVSPTLVRFYKDKSDNVVRDTLLVMDENTIAASAATLNTVLTYVMENFPAAGYGLIVSSHGTGWLPSGYYSNSSYYDSSSSTSQKRTSPARTGSLPDKFGVPARLPYIEDVLEGPAVKSITREEETEDGTAYSYEVDIADFADAIPMHLDYLLFDACLMGGVEVAYELKDVCDVIGFSPAEVLAEGYDYATIAERLIGSSTPDPVGVCEDYFAYYEAQTGDYNSATVSVVDCSGLGALASVCRSLFEKYRSSIASLDGDNVQGYFRSKKHWFYDLEDILVQAGATDEDVAGLEAALDACLLYSAATAAFMPNSSGFAIDTYCGLSMYFPPKGSAYLDTFYKGLAWNMATGLVE